MVLSNENFRAILATKPKEAPKRILRAFAQALISSGASNKIEGQSTALEERGYKNIASLDTGLAGYNEPSDGIPHVVAGEKVLASQIQLGYLPQGAYDHPNLSFFVVNKRARRKEVFKLKDKIALLILGMDVETTGARNLAAFGPQILEALARYDFSDYENPNNEEEPHLFERLSRKLVGVELEDAQRQIVQADLEENLPFFTKNHVIRFRVANVIETVEEQTKKKKKSKKEKKRRISKYSEIDYYVGFKPKSEEKIRTAYEDIDKVSKDASRIGIAQGVSESPEDIDWILVCDSDKPEKAMLLPPEYYYLVTDAVVKAVPPDAVMNDLLTPNKKPKSEAEKKWDRTRVRFLRNRGNN
jgi:hypothetical protein